MQDSRVGIVDANFVDQPPVSATSGLTSLALSSSPERVVLWSCSRQATAIDQR
jgi:hypothetical protein